MQNCEKCVLRGQAAQTKSSHYYFSAYLKHFTSVCVWTTNSEDIGSFWGLWWFEISIPQHPNSIINDSGEAGTDCFYKAICWWLKFLSFEWQISTIGFSRHILNLFTAQQVLNLVQHNRTISINMICTHFICVQSCYPVVEIHLIYCQKWANKWIVTFSWLDFRSYCLNLLKTPVVD